MGLKFPMRYPSVFVSTLNLIMEVMLAGFRFGQRRDQYVLCVLEFSFASKLTAQNSGLWMQEPLLTSPRVVVLGKMLLENGTRCVGLSTLGV